MSGGSVSLLLTAASLALKARTKNRAIKAAWSCLHRDGPQIMAECFYCWCSEESFSGHASGFGVVLRRRYKKPSEIAASLTRAAWGRIE